MSNCEKLENSQSKVGETKNVKNCRENGAGAISKDDHISTPTVIEKAIGKLSQFSSKYSTASMEDALTSPPPPPPSTPVQQKDVAKRSVDENKLDAKLDSENITEPNICNKLEASSNIPPPSSIQVKELSPISNKKNFKKCDSLIYNLKSEKLALESITCKKTEGQNNEIEKLIDVCDKHENKSLTLMEIPKSLKVNKTLELTDRKLKIQKLLEQQSTIKPSVISVAIPLPPPTKTTLVPKVIVTMNEDNENTIVFGKNYEILKNITSNQVTKKSLFNLKNNRHNEEELSLQVLPARSSTPYTHPMPFTTASCELDIVSECVSPVKDDDSRNGNAAVRELHTNFKSKSVTLEIANSCKKNITKTSDLVIRYSRTNLCMIRNEMSNSKLKKYLSPFAPLNIVDCGVIELEARLKRLNILKTQSDAENTRCKNNDNNNNISHKNLKFRCNDMMPAFIKRKFIDESIIKSQPPQPLDFKDPAIISNQRRIGSGRITHNKWTAGNYQQFGNQRYQAKGSESCQINKQLNNENNITVSNEILSSKNSTGAIGVGKSNYVKRVTSGFLVVSNPKDRETEEKYLQSHKNHQNEEPEWFSCGPTSRLDTIELCGFDEEDDHQHLHNGNNGGGTQSSLKKNDADDSKENCIQNANKIEHSGKSKCPDNLNTQRKLYCISDSNNNVLDVKVEDASKVINHGQKSNHELKKSIPFQYDQFSGNTKSRSHINKNHNSSEINITGDHHYQNQKESSRFIPFFGGNASKNNYSEQLDNSSSSSSLNDFFKLAMNSEKKTDPLHLKMTQIQQQNSGTINLRSSSNINMTEMPSVDELEAKWRQKVFSTGNGVKSPENSCKSSINNNNNSDSENFKKLIGQLNNCSVLKTERQHLYNNSQFNCNSTNNINLSTFISKQQLQQKQLLQQQQHQKGPAAVQQINNLQEQYNKQSVFIQQQQAALLTSLQLKTILSRPEAQIYLLGLAKGDISKHGLVVQLANPQLSQREREAITAVLTFTSVQQQQQQQQLDAFSNNLIINQLQNLQNLAFVQQALAAQQQQQNHLQGGNNHLTAMQEVQTHANMIMQNALIKRKIEEQTNVLGLQKTLHANTAAQVGKQHYQQPQQQHSHNRNISGSSNLNTQTVNRNATGSRRLQALQNLFNDSNGIVDNMQQQQNLIIRHVNSDINNMSNYRNNRNANIQNQYKRSSGATSAVVAEVEHQNQRYQQQTRYQSSVMTKSDAHHIARTNKIINPAQQPAIVLPEGNEFN